MAIIRPSSDILAGWDSLPGIATSKQPWRSQPQTSVELYSQYRDNASICWIPGAPDLVTRKTPTLDAQAAYMVGQNGRSVRGDGTGYTYIAASFASQPTTPSKHTDILVVSNWQSGTSYGMLMGNSEKYGFSIETTGELSWRTGLTRYSGHYLDSKTHVVACRHEVGVGVTIFLDGKPCSYQSLSGESGWLTRLWPASVGSDTQAFNVYLAYSQNRLMSDSEIASLSNPYQIFRPLRKVHYFLPPLYEALDETTASDADYISSSTSGQIARIALGSTTDPGVDTGHVMRYRAASDGDRGLIARVVQTGSFPFIVTSKQPWRQQPQVPVEIDWSNSLTKNLAAAVLTNGGIQRELITNQTFSGAHNGIIVGKPLLSGGHGVPSGLSISGSLTVSRVLSNKTPADAITGAPFSFFSEFIPQGDAYGPIISSHEGGSGNGWRIYHDDYQYALNSFAMLSGSSNYAQSNANSLGVSYEYYSQRVAGVLNGTDAKLYINGILHKTVVTNPLFVNNAARRLCVSSTFSSRSSCSVALALVWSRVLDNAEIFSLSTNPWQIFRPRRQITYVDLGRKVIAERTPTLTASPADYTIDLTSGEAATITDYSALALEVEST